MKNVIIVISVIAGSVLLLGGLLWLGSRGSNDPDVVSTSALHWHPQLRIYVKGEEVAIPQNLGLGAVHNPIHTHDDLPLLHLEFSGRVTQDDLRLKNFFRVWGRDITSLGSNVTMTVNGEPNTELGNYIMRDGDKIELRYE